MTHDESIIFSEATAEQFKAADKTLMALESYILANKHVLNNPHVDMCLNHLATLHQVQYGIKPAHSLSVEALGMSPAFEGIEKAKQSLKYGFKTYLVELFWLIEAMRNDAEKNISQLQKLKSDIKILKSKENKTITNKNVSFLEAKFLVSDGNSVTKSNDVIKNLKAYNDKLKGSEVKKNFSTIVNGLSDTTDVIRGIWFLSNDEEIDKVRSTENESKKIIMELIEERKSSSSGVTNLGINGYRFINFSFNSYNDTNTKVSTKSSVNYSGSLESLSAKDTKDLLNTLEELTNNDFIENSLIEMSSKLRTLYGYSFVNRSFRIAPYTQAVAGAFGGMVAGGVVGPAGVMAGGMLGAFTGLFLHSDDLRRSMAITQAVSNFRLLYQTEMQTKNDTIAAAIKWINESA